MTHPVCLIRAGMKWLVDAAHTRALKLGLYAAVRWGVGPGLAPISTPANGQRDMGAMPARVTDIMDESWLRDCRVIRWQRTCGRHSLIPLQPRPTQGGRAGGTGVGLALPEGDC